MRLEGQTDRQTDGRTDRQTHLQSKAMGGRGQDAAMAFHSGFSTNNVIEVMRMEIRMILSNTGCLTVAAIDTRRGLFRLKRKSDVWSGIKTARLYGM